MKEQHDLKRMLSRTLVIVVMGCMLFILASTVTADSQYPPNEYRIPLQHQWNLITVPVNASIAKNQVTIRNNSIDYNFTEAVNHGIIVGTFFGWDRENHTYFIANSRGFEPGKGYWLWAYYPCSLIIHSDVRGDGYITGLHSQWNLLGQTYNSSLALKNLSVLYKGTSYSWANATSTNNEEHHQLIIPSVFNWNSSRQSYDLSTGFTPGEGYWIYAYYNCSLRQVIAGPVILDHSADITGTGNSYVCNASVSDPDGVKSVWLEYWYGSGFHSFVEMNPTGVDSYYETILTIPSGSVDSLHYIIAANDTKNYWNTTSEQIVVVTDDHTPPTISLNFAGNPSDSGGPYYLPGTNTPAPEGYYTNASYQKEKWIQINCTATDNVGIDKVWLHWRNGSQWTNNTYQLTHTTGNYYRINMSTGIAPGPKYSFDLFAVDTSGNTMLYRWLKAGADTTAVDDRRYVQLGGTPTNISYTPYYFYPAQYKYTTGYGPGHNMTNDDILHHDQGPDGTLTDTGYLLAQLPTSVMQERYCIMYVGYWFDETVTALPGTIKNIYHHFWWHDNSNTLTVAYGKSDAGFYRNESWGQSYPTSTTKAHANISYNSKTYYLESALMKITSPQSFTDNDIYEFFVEYYRPVTTNITIINNRSIQSFVIFNVPDNTTLQGQDTDHDGLTDYQELYVTFTNPFVQDTDNDGFNDSIEYACGSDPNNYNAIPTSYPGFSAESPQNQSIAQPLNPSLSITVGQVQSSLMNVTFLTNATGSWQIIGTNHSVLNGRYSQIVTTMNNPNTTYYWSVHCNAGSLWTNKTYSFTTQSFIPTLKWLITSASGESRVGPNVADVNNDGWMEVIRSGANGIVVYNGTTGAVIWNRSMAMIDQHIPLEVIDLNKDGIPEIICSYDTGTMALYGNNGSVYWYNPSAPLYDHHPVAGDIDADGYPEVYVCSSGSQDGSKLGSVTALTHDGKIFAQVPTYYPCYGGLSLGDTNHDGVFELYLNERNVGYNGNTVGKGVRAFWASNLTARWSHPEMLSSSHCPTLVDVNKDGILDVVSLSQNGGGIAVFNSADGSVIHQPLSIPGLSCHSQPTIYDIDGDGNLELMACQDGSKPLVWDLYTWKHETGGRLDGNGCLPFGCWEPPAIADINGDGFVEILACTASNISIFDHHYNFLGSIPLPCYDYYGTSMIVAQDIDHDGLTELVINLNDQLVTYDTIATAPIPRALSQHLYYSQMRGRSPYYTPYGPLIPIVKNEAPTNRSSNQQTNPTLSVYVYDYQHDSMNITFSTNASIDHIWHTITSFVNVHDGTFTASPTAMNTNSTTYWWRVIVTDSTGKSITKVYKFMTVGRHLLTNPSPTDGATGVELNPILSVHVEDRQGSPITILFKTNASGVWMLIGSNTSVGNGTYRQRPTTMNTYSTKYCWSINCTNGIVWTNQTYRFTTFTPSTTSWWNPAWMYRKEIIIDHTKVAGILKKFPVMINISSDATLAAHAQPDGDDIVFTDAQGIKLKHEIELFTSATGRLVAWVNVTSLSSTTDTKLYLYYGNALCSSQQNPQGTWNAEYLMVHHMNETGNIIDSTSHTLNAVNYGTTTELNGKIDGCRYFDSTSDYYDFGAPVALNPGMSSWTISLWTKISFVNNVNILQKWGSSAGFYIKMYNDSGGYNYFQVNDGTNAAYRYWNTTWSDENWHYLTMVINRNTNTLNVYLDGTLHNGLGTGNIAGFGSITTTSNFSFYGGTNGRYDEFSISTTVRNDSWIKTCYNNQNDPASFYRIYPEQPLPPSPPSVTNPQPTDGATNQPFHSTLRITVSQNYSYSMTIIWKTNASGTWAVIGTNSSVNNGIYSCSNTTWVSLSHEKYWWKVETNDNHGNWNNKTYSFTTLTLPPTQGTPKLKSEYGTNTTNEDLICSNQSTNDPNGLNVYNTYHWLKNSTSLTNLLLSFNTQNQTSVKDYSGYNNNGVITGATWTPNGVIGGTYHFSGVDSQDYISIPHSTTLDGGGTWTAMTIEHWIYLTGDQINSRTIAKMATSGNLQSYQIGFQSSTPYNRLLAGVYIGSNTYKEVTYNTSLTTGVWYHVALTYKSGIGLKLYVNGVAVATIPGTGNIHASTGNKLYIGCRYGTERFFDGSIDEVKIYPYALTTEQIYQNYLESKDGLSLNSTIVPEETSVGNVWQCGITPSNGYLDGGTILSNTLVIKP